MDRITRDEMLMGFALLAARRTTCRRAPEGVGAVISRDGRSISTGNAGTPPKAAECGKQCDLTQPCRRTTHAEANAILFAARYGVAVDGCTMHATTSPCFDCAKMIVNCGIKRFVYLNEYRDPEGLQYLKRNGVKVEKFNPDAQRHCK